MIWLILYPTQIPANPPTVEKISDENEKRPWFQNEGRYPPIAVPRKIQKYMTNFLPIE
jgi:hypothetical protein